MRYKYVWVVGPLVGHHTASFVTKPRVRAKVIQKTNRINSTMPLCPNLDRP